MTGTLATIPTGALPSAELVQQLEEHARHARGAFAANTERARRADMLVFSGWCADAGLDPLPAGPETVVAFVDAMAATRAPATVRRYVSSIGYAHRAAGVPSPTDTERLKLALKRLHRTKGRAQAQAAPLNRARVDAMLGRIGTGLRGLRDRALLAVAYDTLARRSELVALLYEDLADGLDGDGTITVRRSKTDQEGVGATCYLAPDTMRTVRAWTGAAGVTGGRLFRSVGKAGRIGDALDAGEVSRLFKKMAVVAGIPEAEASRISGHSVRVGGAQDMARIGGELPEIMQAGRWKAAEMVARYIQRQNARRGMAAKLAEKQGRT